MSSFGTPLENYKDEIERIFVDVKACLKLQAGQVPHLEEDEKNRQVFDLKHFIYIYY